MLSNEGFKGSIIAQKYEKDLKAVLSIKHISLEPQQKFLDSLADHLDQPSIKDCFNQTMTWNKLNFEISLGMKFFLSEETYFQADVESINVSKKFTNSGIEYHYVIKLHKEIDSKIDTLIATNYLKRKDHDVNGKLSPVLFDFRILAL